MLLIMSPLTCVLVNAVNVNTVEPYLIDLISLCADMSRSGDDGQIHIGIHMQTSWFISLIKTQNFIFYTVITFQTVVSQQIHHRQHRHSWETLTALTVLLYNATFLEIAQLPPYVFPHPSRSLVKLISEHVKTFEKSRRRGRL